MPARSTGRPRGSSRIPEGHLVRTGPATRYIWTDARELRSKAMAGHDTDRGRRTVVVTGGGTGIGRAVAEVFAADGETVVLLGRREDVLVRTSAQLQASAPDAHVVWRRCDVSQAGDVETFRQWLTSEVSATVDVVVNCAGGVHFVADDAPLQEAAANAWEELGGNLVGTYLIVHALMPLLRRPGGRIVNISSIAALRGG